MCDRLLKELALSLLASFGLIGCTATPITDSSSSGDSSSGNNSSASVVSSSAAMLSSSSVVMMSSSSLINSSSIAVSSSAVISSSSVAQSSSSAPPYVVPANNFAQNGGVENGVQNWSSNVETVAVARATAQKHSGAASLSITGRNADWHGATFSVGALTKGNDYDVAVWVKLAAGAPDTEIRLTAKRQNDADDATYLEYTGVDSVMASANAWSLLQGIYSHSGTTDFDFFIIESPDTMVSYFVDDFSIGGEVEVPTSPTLGGPYYGGIASGEMKFLGNVIAGYIPSDYTKYWNQITMENAGKWDAVEGTRGTMNWKPIDNAINFARTNGLIFKHHVFVWGSQEPTWIKDGGGLSSAQVKAEVEEFMQLYCSRYPDTQIIDVVNEPLHAPATYRNLIGGNGATGWDWIIWSFEQARKYCPNATLLLNDYGIISDTNAIDRYKVILKLLTDRKLVDGVGIQSHAFNVNAMNATQLKNNLDRLAQSGVPIYVTELDIDDTAQVNQRNKYAELFPVFWEHQSVVGVTIWGYRDNETWRKDENSDLLNGESPKPALQWLQTYFANRRK